MDSVASELVDRDARVMGRWVGEPDSRSGSHPAAQARGRQLVELPAARYEKGGGRGVLTLDVRGAETSWPDSTEAFPWDRLPFAAK